MLMPGLMWVVLIIQIGLCLRKKRHSTFSGICIGVTVGILISWYIEPRQKPPWVEKVIRESEVINQPTDKFEDKFKRLEI